MRGLPISVISGTNVPVSIKLEIATLEGDTFVHCNNDIAGMTPIRWDIPFTGGLGKPSYYDVTLSMCIDQIKERINAYVRSEVRLNATVGPVGNTATFQPHLGRVRDISRGDPNALTIRVVDKFLDDNALLPAEAMADSFSNLHLEELLTGNPLYYGLHHRPFYHVAVDCAIGSLLGPRNVSSENHVNSVWFNSDPFQGDSTAEKHLILMENIWAQQSGATNLIDGGEDFEVKDVSFSDVRLWEYSGRSQHGTPRVTDWNDGFLNVNCGAMGDGNPWVGVNFNNDLLFGDLLYVKGSVRWDSASDTQAAASDRIFFQAASGSGNVGVVTFNGQFDGGPAIWTTTYSYHANSDHFGATNNNAQRTAFRNMPKSTSIFVGVRALKDGLGLTAPLAFQNCLFIGAKLLSENYSKASIFSPAVNSADIAISKNPAGILDDVFTNHISLAYDQAQSSATQVDVQSYEFQCYFAERKPIADIVDEFGQLASFYSWIGDSGTLSYRAYQQSADAVVDLTVGPNNLLSNIQLRESPLGTEDQSFAKRVKLKYNWHFQKNSFERTAQADPLNNAFCQSMENAGVGTELEIGTEYITDPDTASLSLGGLVRKHCQGTEFVTFQGGPALMNLEVADVVKMQHPMIVGSESLYQLVSVQLDLFNGTVTGTGGRLVAI